MKDDVFYDEQFISESNDRKTEKFFDKQGVTAINLLKYTTPRLTEIEETNQIDEELSAKEEKPLNVDVNNYNSELAQSEVSEVTSEPTSENSTSGLIKNEVYQNYPNSQKSERNGESKFLSKIITM